MAYWDTWALAGVEPSDLRTWISSLDMTAKFARNLMTPLCSVFDDALNDDLIRFNPFDRIAMSKLLKQTAKSSEYEVAPFMAEERAALIKAARADERPLVQFWFNSGLRPGELIAFKWPKVDLNQVVNVEKGPTGDAQIRKTLWQPLCLRAGVLYRNPYQVRHTFASALLTAGRNPWYVAQQLGHVDVQMVFKIYGKFIPAEYQKPNAH